MNRVILERITASFVVILTIVLALGLIVIIANGVFAWDLFPPMTEKMLYFLGAAAFVCTIASAFINLMINISRLTYFVEKIADKQTK